MGRYCEFSTILLVYAPNTASFQLSDKRNVNRAWSRAYDPDYFRHKYKGSHGGLADSSYGDEYGTVPGRGLWWSIYENEYTQKETSVRPALILNVKLANWVKFRAEGNYNYYYTRSENKQLGTGYANTNSGYYGMN